MILPNDLKYVGVNDHAIDLFEGQYKVPNGISYNSYVLLDDEIAIFDTVDERFSEVWLNKVSAVLGARQPDYLIVQHMEPDHSGSIVAFAEKYEQAKIVSSAKSFSMMKNFFGDDFHLRQLVVGENSVLNLGKHELKFITAPMVHWPEVIVTYDSYDKILFTADAFGKFGALDVNEEWACEARRYYFGIVGKYGVQVQNLLKKVSVLNVNYVCPLHGPVLSENLSYYLNLYDVWSSYKSESSGIFIPYASIYGNTAKAVQILAEELIKAGQKVVTCDLAREDMSQAIEDAFRYDRIVFASSSYNGDVFPFMREFINCLVERNFQNKTVAFIENGSWGPCASRVMKGLLESCHNLTVLPAEVKILSTLNDESATKLYELKNQLII